MGPNSMSSFYWVLQGVVDHSLQLVDTAKAAALFAEKSKGRSCNTTTVLTDLAFNVDHTSDPMLGTEFCLLWAMLTVRRVCSTAIVLTNFAEDIHHSNLPVCSTEAALGIFWHVEVWYFEAAEEFTSPVNNVYHTWQLMFHTKAAWPSTIKVVKSLPSAITLLTTWADHVHHVWKHVCNTVACLRWTFHFKASSCLASGMLAVMLPSNRLEWCVDDWRYFAVLLVSGPDTVRPQASEVHQILQKTNREICASSHSLQSSITICVCHATQAQHTPMHEHHMLWMCFCRAWNDLPRTVSHHQHQHQQLLDSTDKRWKCSLPWNSK